jgi:hypothetical protein
MEATVGSVVWRGVKLVLLQVKQELVHNQVINGIVLVLGALVNFWIQSFQLDVILFLLLMGVIAMNTFSGVKVAKKHGKYLPSVLRKSVQDKLVGYVSLLVILGLFISMMFLAAKLDDRQIFSNFIFNAPIVLTLMFFASVELRSFLDNARELEWKVPGFVSRMPDKIDKTTDEYFK